MIWLIFLAKSQAIGLQQNDSTQQSHHLVGPVTHHFLGGVLMEIPLALLQAQNMHTFTATFSSVQIKSRWLLLICVTIGQASVRFQQEAFLFREIVQKACFQTTTTSLQKLMEVQRTEQTLQCVLVSCQHATSQNYQRKRVPHLRKCFHKISLWASLLLIFLISDLLGKVHQNKGGAIPDQVVFDCIRRQAEQALRKKPVNSTAQWLLLQFLARGPCPV